jgi:hypothetical protein
MLKKTNKLIGILLLSVSLPLLTIVSVLPQTAKADPTYTTQTLGYIEFDNDSYIDTGIALGDGAVGINTKVEIRFSEKDGELFYDRVFGVFNQFGFYSVTQTSESWYTTYGGSSYRFGYTGVWQDFIPDYNVHTVVKDGNSTYFDGQLVSTITATQPTSSLNIFLGAENNNGNATTSNLDGNVYTFKIWQNDVLVRDLVPTARYTCSSAVEYGFIDRVNNDAWYGNSGTGILTGSPEVLDTTCPIPEPEPSPALPIVPSVPNTGIGPRY